MRELPRGIYEKRKGSKIYWIRWTDEHGKERRQKCGTLSAARDRLALRMSEKIRRVSDGIPKNILFDDLLDDAVKYVEASHASSEDMVYKLNRIRRDFGKILTHKITQSAIMSWLEGEARARSWTAASRNRYQAAWSRVFSLAKANKKVRDNPCVGIPKKREDNARERYLTQDEERALVAAITKSYPAYLPVFQLALHTGARASELLRAEIGDYPVNGQFRIRQEKVRGQPGVRFVPATPVAISAYERLAGDRPTGSKLCTKTVKRGVPNLTQVRYWFDPCMKAAGIVDFKWHDLRHTYASRLVMGGVPLAVVSKFMGHSSIEMTMRYSHLAPANHEQAIRTMMGYYD